MSETNGKHVNSEAFWKTIKRKYQTVDVPHLGKVRIQNLTDGEQRELSGKQFDDEGNQIGFRYMFADRAIAQIVNDENDQLFGEMHRERLTEVPYYVTKGLMHQMVQHNEEGWDAPTHEELKKK